MTHFFSPVVRVFVTRNLCAKIAKRFDWDFFSSPKYNQQSLGLANQNLKNETIQIRGLCSLPNRDNRYSFTSVKSQDVTADFIELSASLTSGIPRRERGWKDRKERHDMRAGKRIFRPRRRNERGNYRTFLSVSVKSTFFASAQRASSA